MYLYIIILQTSEKPCGISVVYKLIMTRTPEAQGRGPMTGLLPVAELVAVRAVLQLGAAAAVGNLAPAVRAVATQPWPSHSPPAD